LRRRVQGAAARFSAMNDQAMRRIGADLHDGPVQMMSFAALRLDAVRRRVPEGPGRADVDAVEGALKDSITELRNISRGMSLPDLQRRSVPELLQGLAEAQAARAGHPVPVSIDMGGLGDLPDEVKTCLYRVAQEGLTNAWRHGGGESALDLAVEDGVLRLSVLDRGPGFPEGRAAPAEDDSSGLGLAGLADRVEALGGELKTLNRPGGGAELRMVLDLRAVE
jgi:signal transduction histidine kinase